MGVNDLMMKFQLPFYHSCTHQRSPSWLRGLGKPHGEGFLCMQGDTDGREGDTDDGEDANRLQPSNIIPEIGVVTCMHIRRLCQQASLCLALYLKSLRMCRGR